MKIKVEIKGNEELAKLLKDMPRQKRDGMKKVIGDYSLKIQQEAKKNIRQEKAIYTATLVNSIIAELSKIAIEAEVGATAVYAPFVEFGTRPHFPPLEALELWAKRHGFASAWPICKAIAERGLPPRPYLGPAYEKYVGSILDDVKKMLEGR